MESIKELKIATNHIMEMFKEIQMTYILINVKNRDLDLSLVTTDNNQQYQENLFKNTRMS